MASCGGIWLAVALAAAGAAADDRARHVQTERTSRERPTASERARLILSGGTRSSPPDGGAEAKGRFQTELPGQSPEEDAPSPPQPARGDFQTELPHAPAPPITFSLGPLEQLLRILAWTGLAVLVVLLAVWLVRSLRALRLRRRGIDAEVMETARAPGPVAIPIGDAEALAAAGSYAEAVHALLLRTLEALSRAARLSPALTSREIVSQVPLAPRARLALRALVYAVEISRFGGDEPGEAEYRACRERFEEFLATYGTPA